MRSRTHTACMIRISTLAADHKVFDEHTHIRRLFAYYLGRAVATEVLASHVRELPSHPFSSWRVPISKGARTDIHIYIHTIYYVISLIAYIYVHPS